MRIIRMGVMLAVGFLLLAAQTVVAAEASAPSGK